MIEIECQNPDCGKKQTIEVSPPDHEYEKHLAGMLDGSSPMYSIPPGEDSEIGKCESCGGRFKAKVI